MGTTWRLAAVGDVFLNRPDTIDAFEFVRPVFEACDIVFGNCEGAYTERGTSTPTAGGFSLVASPDQARPLRSAGFSIMSLANNHALDASHDGLADTCSLLKTLAIQPAGAGADLADARRLTCLQAASQRVGFLAFTSVFPAGYEARDTTPGVAAMRAHTHYFVHPEAFGRVEPGADPDIRTFPFREDMVALEALVTAARAECDVLVASFHWGKSVRPGDLMAYELDYGRAAVDFGADVVLGHHHHLLRAVEIYRRKPIFYGLSHFAFDMPDLEAKLGPARIDVLKRSGAYAIFPREGFPLLPFHPDARMTAIAVCEFDGASLVRQSLIPCQINPLNQPVPVDPSGDDGKRILDYMISMTRQVGFKTVYSADGARFGGCTALEVYQDQALDPSSGAGRCAHAPTLA